MPLTPLAVAALGVLVERPCHPYELMCTLITRRRDSVVKLRAASLYHVIGALRGAGLIRSLGTDKVGNRPERTTYEITPAGRAALTDAVAAMLATVADEYPAFDLALSEAHALPAADVAGLLDQRLTALHGLAGRLRGGLDQAEQSGTPPVYTIDTRHRLALVEREIELVEGLRDDIARGAIAWPSSDPDG
ncbi:MAG: PadR family transcriptional regulator [Propionibacteriaceae bacterium]|jgi:DNA-binding PadR family transcriptional regulator|nr:PadR family transcriptional regulator [Propionibacteriaceae bacterium]